MAAIFGCPGDDGLQPMTRERTSSVSDEYLRYLSRPGHIEKRFPIDRKKLERLIIGVCVSVCHCMCACAHVCERVYACVSECECVCACVCIHGDNVSMCVYACISVHVCMFIGNCLWQWVASVIRTL